MFKKGKKARDAFSFSLGGMTAVSSFVSAPVVADDRINNIRDAHVKMLQARRAEAAKAAEQPSAGDADLCMQNA
ncbi:MAG: hypothetical protein WBM34_03925 [Woeseiaceae bacterium]